MINDYRKQTIEDLFNTYKGKRDELQKLAQTILERKEKNVAKVKFLKKDIARIQTVISEKRRESGN